VNSKAFQGCNEDMLLSHEYGKLDVFVMLLNSKTM
jgi:hypothetical protein